MYIRVDSNRDGTDYCMHNLQFLVHGHDLNKPTEFFVLRADPPDTHVKVRLFFTRNELLALQLEIAREIARVLEPVPSLKNEQQNGDAPSEH